MAPQVMAGLAALDLLVPIENGFRPNLAKAQRVFRFVGEGGVTLTLTLTLPLTLTRTLTLTLTRRGRRRLPLGQVHLQGGAHQGQGVHPSRVATWPARRRRPLLFRRPAPAG